MYALCIQKRIKILKIFFQFLNILLDVNTYVVAEHALLKVLCQIMNFCSSL